MSRFVPKDNSCRKTGKDSTAFSLIELLVTMSVLVMLMVILSAIIGQLGRTVTHATGKMDAFQAARSAFEVMTQNISQATLVTYWDYDNLNAPQNYVRKSDLHFLCGPSQGGNGGTHGIFFQAPLSRSKNNVYAEKMLNAVGYSISMESDQNYLPNVPGLQPRERFRLMQYMQPTEDLEVYQKTDGSWLTNVRSQGWPLAENVIALVIWPKSGDPADNAGTGLTANYDYDSRSSIAIQHAQLPPILQVTMVAIDESSAKRISASELKSLLNGLFIDISHYDDDLNNLKSSLASRKVNYQVFNSVVSLRESQWSATP